MFTRKTFIAGALVAAAALPSSAVSAAMPEALLGTWQWVGTVTPVEELRPAIPERYTIEFLAEDRVAIRADCNRGFGVAAIGADGEFAAGPIALTRMFCLGSHGDRFARDIGEAVHWFIEDGRLFLDLPIDSGTLEFSRAGE